MSDRCCIRCNAKPHEVKQSTTLIHTSDGAGPFCQACATLHIAQLMSDPGWGQH
jgi:hypothetical protein